MSVFFFSVVGVQKVDKYRDTIRLSPGLDLAGTNQASAIQNFGAQRCIATVSTPFTPTDAKSGLKGSFHRSSTRIQ